MMRNADLLFKDNDRRAPLAVRCVVISQYEQFYVKRCRAKLKPLSFFRGLPKLHSAGLPAFCFRDASTRLRDAPFEAAREQFCVFS